MIVFMNLSLKQLTLPVMMLMSLLSTEAAGGCRPPPGCGDEKALTTCPDRLNLTLTWPENFHLETTVDLQIRSCDKKECNWDTRFAVGTEDGMGGNLAEMTLSNGDSKIPLKASLVQTAKNASIDLPYNLGVAYTCQVNNNTCTFHGSGLTSTECSDCVNFKLHLEANLQDLIKNDKLIRSGKHEINFNFYIQQNYTSSGSGDSDFDSGQFKRLVTTISMNVPDLVQISGLKDMQLSQEASVDEGGYGGTQNFCVFRLGGQSFSIEATGTNDTVDSFQLANNTTQIPYTMQIGRKGGVLSEILPNTITTGTDWMGDCGFTFSNTKAGSDTNMALRVQVAKDEVENTPPGRFKDTITLTVRPH